MSLPREPDPVKLIASLFSPEKAILHKAIQSLSSMFGPIDTVSHELLFDRTRYYAREMGWPLYRRFVSLRDLIPADHLVEVKLKTNGVERGYLHDGKRRVNIDPGYLCAERLILATGKNYVHRVYLSRGIYADLTLIYRKGSYRALPWTYPDYAEPETIRIFNEIRGKYMNQLKEMRRLDKKHDSIWQG
ncbi:MAG: DUF4416 domain-containing protein [Thermoplasmata archaeon]|nr:MAG: DUF4416 domain-containing protein [Thermoplasmata archaeon]